MTELMVIDIGRNALYTVMYLAGPVLILSLVVGLTISIFQAATMINEMTLTFIPKLVAIGAGLLFFLPWMIGKYQSFFHYLMRMMDQLLR